MAGARRCQGQPNINAMLICIFRYLLSRSVVLLQSGLLLVGLSAGSWAATANLAPGLSLTLPEPLAVRVVELEEKEGELILVGEIEERESYFMAALKIGAWERNHVLWRRLEDAIRKRSDSGNFVTGVRGSFTTAEGEGVWYTLYEYESNERPLRQIYYLLKSDQSAYWITLTVVEGVDVALVLPVVRALIRRVQLAP
ncbi:hypothetical protein [Marinimicrobium agarilyticum]|uniref:hypothetical protein n=1 Tax=Marinimicrobium agarilyticum TaxID=306546 RepID=UPI000417177E|nr:hypothetical protein [Marinimicrobium agarilyticum]